MSASSWPETPAEPRSVDRPRVEAAAPTPRWRLSTRVAFRFAFVYLLLYNLTTPFELIDATYALWQKMEEAWGLIVRPVATAVFGVRADVLPNGSGDTTFNYVQVFVMLVLSGMVTAVWSLLDRRRPNYTALHAWLRVWVRFVLFTAMTAYGVAKVIQLQFSAPILDRLLQPIGDASPMGLLWTFMGLSRTYNVFTGLGELLGGVLLTTRRTTLLGALIVTGVMSNVIMLNFSYDVPVKLYSTHLAVMALFLALPDLRRLADMFVLNRPTAPAVLRPSFRSPRLEAASLVARTLLVVLFVGFSLKKAYDVTAKWKPLELAPLYGIWNVESMSIDGVPRPPLLTDGTRWRRVVISSHRLFSIHLMDDTRTRYMMINDAARGTVALSRGTDKKWRTTLAYRRPAPATLLLSGVFDGHRIAATLRKDSKRTFLLTTRGFHWINEYPYNR